MSSPRRVVPSDLTRLRGVSDPQISPDGRRVAFVLTTASEERDGPVPGGLYENFISVDIGSTEPEGAIAQTGNSSPQPPTQASSLLSYGTRFTPAFATPPVDEDHDSRNSGEDVPEVVVQYPFPADHKQKLDARKGVRRKAGENFLFMPWADAMRLSRVVQRRALADERRTPLLLTPGTYDLHAWEGMIAHAKEPCPMPPARQLAVVDDAESRHAADGLLATADADR